MKSEKKKTPNVVGLDGVTAFLDEFKQQDWIYEAVSGMAADVSTDDLNTWFEKLKRDLDYMRDRIKSDRMSEALRNLGGFDVTVVGDIPEVVDLKFKTNGPQGGNHSHGCCTTLEIKWDSGCHLVEVEIEDPQFPGSSPGRVTFTARGDWELHGLVSALIELGDKLRTTLEQAKESKT